MAKNPLFTLKTFDWVTTDPFSRDTRGVNPCSHFSFTIQKLHTYGLSDIYIQTLPSQHLFQLLKLFHFSTDSLIKQVTTNKFLLIVTLIVLLDVSLFVLVKSKVVMGLVSQMMRVLG